MPWHTRIGEFEATPRAQPTDPPHPPVAWPHLRRDRTNFVAPNGNASANAFGTITSTFDARQVQLGVRVLF